MAESIYRQSALDRMANPERLDASLALVARPTWLLLAAITLAIGFGLIWAIVTQAPVKIQARGILIDRTGLAEVVAADAGRIEAVLVAPGEAVRVGQPVARVARTELSRELTEARAKLADAQARYARLQGFYGSQSAREAGADSIHLSTIGDSRAALVARARFLEEKLGKMNALVGRGFIQKDRMVDVQIELADVREKTANLGESALRVRVDATKRAGETGLALLDEQRVIDEQQRLIARLGARLGDEQLVRSTHDGRVTEIKVNAGDVIAAGTALATVAPEAGSGSLIALLYVPTADGKRIEPGMAAEIVPTTVERAVYGHIRGTVVSVAPLPATAQGMRRLLQNDQLVAELTAGGVPIEVRIALVRDPANPSGFGWSASHGPRTRISAGSGVAGAVVVDRKRVIGMLLPASARD